jgi:hypothetical protein
MMTRDSRMLPSDSAPLPGKADGVTVAQVASRRSRAANHSAFSLV